MYSIHSCPQRQQLVHDHARNPGLPLLREILAHLLMRIRWLAWGAIAALLAIQLAADLARTQVPPPPSAIAAATGPVFA